MEISHEPSKVLVPTQVSIRATYLDYCSKLKDSNAYFINANINSLNLFRALRRSFSLLEERCVAMRRQ